MTVEIIVVGKTDTAEIARLTEMYLGRINFHAKTVMSVIADVRNSKSMSEAQQRTAEGGMIMKRIGDGDYVALLDERGDQYRSVEFAAWLGKRMASGLKKLCFVIGGPYGFSEEVYGRADCRISLSKMTFSHQIVRALFTEQLYRAFTILNNEPYHHE